jgi:hypothetical protein
LSNGGKSCILIRSKSLLALLGLLLSPRAEGQVSVVQIHSGGSSVGTWAADEFYSGGSTGGPTAAVDTSHVANPARMSAYQTERCGYSTYTIPNLTPAAPTPCVCISLPEADRATWEQLTRIYTARSDFFSIYQPA